MAKPKKGAIVTLWYCNHDDAYQSLRCGSNHCVGCKQKRVKLKVLEHEDDNGQAIDKAGG